MKFFNYRPDWATARDECAVPVGEECWYCHQPIQPADEGVLMPHVESDEVADWKPWHLRCFRKALGI